MNMRRWIGCACVMVGLSWVAPALHAEQAAFELKVDEKVVYRKGAPDKPAPPCLAWDFFGKGLTGMHLNDDDEIRYVAKDVPEGDYFVSMAASSPAYFVYAEIMEPRTQFYLNDTRVPWTGTTQPLRPEGAPEGTWYRAEMLAGKVHVKPNDVLRMISATSCGMLAGPVRLYRQSPQVCAVYQSPTDVDPTQSVWLHAQWGQTRPAGDTIVQDCTLFNPGVLAHTFTLKVSARDYSMRPLLDKVETLTLGPGQQVVKSFEFKPGTDWRVRLSLTAGSAQFWPDVRLSKFWVRDVTAGSRPNMLLNGPWEFCYVPGIDVGSAPPAGTKWEKINVPSQQPNTKGHCAWYRRVIDAPAYLNGERIVLKCNEVLSTATVYLNGQKMGRENRGSDPFEMDVTAGFKPGQKNEILIAVEDWLAYSPKNRQRVANGESPVFKDGMLDVADYDAGEWIGIRCPLWLEARPAVSVDDVFVATSVRQKKLTLVYRLANAGKTDQQATLRPEILDAGQVVRTLPERKATVPAGGKATVTIEQDWPEAKCWWPDDPHLYVLRTALGPASGAADVHVQRFGFREFWIDGVSFVLNGTRVKLRSSCISGAGGKIVAQPFWEQDRRYQAIYDQQRTVKEQRAIQLFRTHLWTRCEEGVDLADEDGLMVKLETGFHQQPFTLDNRFWEAATTYELRIADLYKNHASVMLWSGGNENMWGILYNGEIAKTVFNVWQIKIAKAFHQFDLMRRPFEWEADGDLMGGGEYYATHYPHELASFPALPPDAWWAGSPDTEERASDRGPLDGKTVIPYSMGPITLGAKPLTVGESFWPAGLERPFGTTIMIGDEAYLGGNYLYNAWCDSSRFFLNGFRDVEFAVIDSFLPLTTVTPQAVVLKEETCVFHGGRTLRRHLNVHNDILAAAKLALQWSLTDAGGKSLAAGQQVLDMAPAELKRLVLEVPLPATGQPIEATWRVELLDGAKVVHEQQRPWRICPPPALKAPAGLKLALYDPPGQTAAMLKKMNVPFELLGDLKDIPPGAALMLGEGSLKQAPQGAWREAVSAFVAKGGKAVILAQTEALDFLPVSLTQVKDRRTTIAFVRAADHPVMAALSDADLKWWADDHYVSTCNYRKPLAGNWLPLADAGAMEGVLETPLLEEYDGGGSYIICQFLLAEKVGLAPQAAVLVQNLLDYLAKPACYRTLGQTAWLAGSNKSLRAALESAGLAGEDLTGKLDQLKADRFKAAIVDAASALDAGALEPLRAFAQAGGQVMVCGAGPQKQALLESLLGIHVRFFQVAKEPDDVQNHLVRVGNSGLLAGVSNHDLYWANKDYLALVRREGWWWCDCGPRTPGEFIAEYFCAPVASDADRAVLLTRPCALLAVPAGKGRFVVSQLRLDQPLQDTEPTVGRLKNLLLTNLGCRIAGQGGSDRARLQRLAKYQFAPVDLGPYVNRGLKDNKAAGIIGWSDQGQNDMRALPTGGQTFAGVPFTVGAPRSAVVLYSTTTPDNQQLPKDVKGIKVGRRANMLFFLHGVAYLSNGRDVCAYRVNYADGSSVDIPIENGRQIADWWFDPLACADSMSKASTVVAWRGDNPMRKGVALYCFEWTNPSPDKEVKSVDFRTSPKNDYYPVPCLVGLTTAVASSNEGVVEDVIGTRGLKVRIGTELKDVYYIGVGGIDETHPFAPKALEAHKAMVVGQKVTIVFDDVVRTGDGRTVAYVFLGKDLSNENMLNSRVIGDGLAKLGNFEGNARYRMFMENLGFITQQNKKGLWGTTP